MKVKIDALPPSDNTLYSNGFNGRRFLVKEGKDWKKLVSMLANKFKPLEGEVAVSIEFVRTDKRRWDGQSHIKTTLDALQGHFYNDDSQIHHLTVIKRSGNKPLTLIECRPI